MASIPDCGYDVCGNDLCGTLDITAVPEGRCCWATFETCVTGCDVICDDDTTPTFCAAGAVTDADADGESLGSTLFDDTMDFCTALDVAVDVWIEPAAAALGRLIFMVGGVAVVVGDITLPGETVVSFCCDGEETATTDDVICCGGNVID